uniref:hypothetical protein n=1 Tax=Thermobacillus composti TaxID=377615 RepID=UPI00022C41F2|nr:hypothetical protein [Thermobacillus composti]
MLDNAFPGHVLPDMPAIVLVVFLAILTNLVAVLLPKEIASAAEILFSAAVIACLFIVFPFGQASILLTLGASAYGNFGQLADRQKREKYKELERKLREADAVELLQDKDQRRIAADLGLALIVCSGAVLFFLLAPDSYVAAKLIAGMTLLSVLAKMIERIGNFFLCPIVLAAGRRTTGHLLLVSATELSAEGCQGSAERIQAGFAETASPVYVFFGKPGLYKFIWGGTQAFLSRRKCFYHPAASERLEKRVCAIWQTGSFQGERR